MSLDSLAKAARAKQQQSKQLSASKASPALASAVPDSPASLPQHVEDAAQNSGMKDAAKRAAAGQPETLTLATQSEDSSAWLLAAAAAPIASMQPSRHICSMS